LGVKAVPAQNHGKARTNDWFAKELGDGWETTGDGIYSYVDDKPGPSDDDRSLERDLIDQVAPDRGTRKTVDSWKGLSDEEQRQQLAEIISAKLAPSAGENVPLIAEIDARRKKL
jgi:hypothetical protein